MKERYVPKIEVASIGQDGENSVNISYIVIDAPHYRLAEMSGMGAVMDSKNLKAILVKGNIKPPIENPTALREILKNDCQNIRHYIEAYCVSLAISTTTIRCLWLFLLTFYHYDFSFTYDLMFIMIFVRF